MTSTLQGKNTAGQVLADQDPKAARQAVAARNNGRLLDLSAPVDPQAELTPVLPGDPEALEVLRHSAAHIMAEAVKELFPGVKVAIGPAIEDGFYYDFDYERPFTPEDLPAIEDKMREIVKQNASFECEAWDRGKARQHFADQGEQFKVELIDGLEAEEVGIYRQGGFTDLCRGPHLPSTGRLGAFKLTSVAGAYWRGDEKRPMLSRIYGTAFFDKKELKQHLALIEEAKKRDHRKLGRELELFSFHDEIGAGLVVWHPRGMILRTIIENLERSEHLKRGYSMVQGPQILKRELWERSGHFDNYRENMYFTEVDEVAYGLKPMNCLAHMLIYKSKLRSYRDLPLRLFELGLVHRHEKSGVMHGLTRVRAFTQDDAHLICRPDQLETEILGVMAFVTDFMELFGFEYSLELSTRPEKSIGSDEDWERATAALTKALITSGKKYDINEGDGAFYGPKIDFKLTDALKRSWQCATIQCDFTLPERFELSYIDRDGEPKRPVMLHRVILGSIERFIGVLVEHYAGAFPLWLAPEQVRVLTVTERADEWAQEITQALIDADLRAEVDLRNEKLGAKVREAQMMKVPYMVILGDREVEERQLTPRLRNGKNLQSQTLEKFINLLKEEQAEPMRLLRQRAREGRGTEG
ncbi:MAG: threonine--tRNA ligase [Desulfarculus sp.]|nr:threonine--tRNA ligase [Pseudomonadota bacterium]MBV1715446.1 threonine--tRNA ligase [Desulfarculus sp.]MBU4573260.1 threonine--tRNA ligase [Pseudomonadota bacterium]MBU4599286.1 threonine--tRNA ligase [Pseudomonadota bacterium]MBV1739707.1 threonine--tRNA ligase [Desulfarculus sp.]